MSQRPPGGVVGRLDARNGGATTSYIVDEQSPTGYSEVVEEYQGGNLTNSYVYGSGLDPISQNTSTGGAGLGSVLLLSDGHSGVRQAVQAGGAELLVQRFDAFGNTVSTLKATGTPFSTVIGYRGQRFDAVLGQYDMRARMYDPSNGRFTVVDPAAGTYSDPLQLMRYGYAGADPVWRMDPSGRDFSIGGLMSSFSIGGALQGISAGTAIAAINPHAAGTGQETAFQIGLGISGALGCQGTAAFRSIMGLPMGLALGAAVGFYGGFIAGYADALADDPLVSEQKLLTTAIVSGILGAIQGILAFAYLGRGGACFAAGKPLRTPEGETPIEQLKPGDRVLARDEHDPTGPVEAKVVEEVFVYEAQVLYLTVGGQRIGTTSEHPFYVPGRGSTNAVELRPGDVLVGHDGQTVSVQALEAGEWATVYNIRVQDHHTYFVGKEEWGFSVWAHNQCRIGVHDTSPKSGDAIVAAGKINFPAWVQPFDATAPVINGPLTVHLLAGGIGTGAAQTGTTLIIDITGEKEDRHDPGGAIGFPGALPVAGKLIYRIKDAGDPDEVDAAILAVKAYYKIP